MMLMWRIPNLTFPLDGDSLRELFRVTRFQIRQNFATLAYFYRLLTILFKGFLVFGQNSKQQLCCLKKCSLS